ncbi:hypothetical protein PPMP20_09990 [Paraburkholderia phymatum]|uniref:Uncharacterized protein n=1 Tax=Paraburkholderia phymatum (strain DSM 17167 / CIP 108236 / LMG 21445 / STM815) TaxID=391038 RepID=B2JDA8_PARP8|nr:hypothetical protein [Paraburkholderia phymatum]ACC69625.1 conserved hypothetical protein [Paraburkholderia phymatum STM815]
MGEFLPDYLIREQAAVDALIVFGVLRAIGAVLAYRRGWHMATIERCFIGAALLYCLPQLFDLLTHMTSTHAAAAELEGKLGGCAIVLVLAPVVRHKLGYE